eukprot:TRINITY_DN4397_c0_g1_i2.p2 TRINITY_DN4397_c0_g1~~TRINITY_DN4397_c0_g1_i2.p2  ORF type:complete len:167 (+),score=45.09 TRINITY_DN4397_c0_g1_i2:952-1452(+)
MPQVYASSTPVSNLAFCQVYSVDIDSIYEFRRGQLELTEHTVQSACQSSDVIILGVPSKDYKLPIEYIRDDAVVVNVASFKNVDEAALAEAKPNVKFVPMVGKMTVAMLERNLIRLYENFHSPAARAKAVQAQAEVTKQSEQEEQAVAAVNVGSMHCNTLSPVLLI